VHLETSDASTIQCRFIRGLANPVAGGPDLPVAGDTIVSLHANTNPPFADALADQVASSDPIVRLDGVTLPQASGLISVHALSRPRSKMLEGEDVNVLLAGWLTDEELADWEQLRHDAYEVQVTVDTSARYTRRTTIQFSWTRADSYAWPSTVYLSVRRQDASGPTGARSARRLGAIRFSPE
jgi:hypothetical protein